MNQSSNTLLRSSTQKVLIIAHRGSCGIRPEHTLEAYSKAIEVGSDYLEQDVVMTKDGVVIVSHDRELSGFTDIEKQKESFGEKVKKEVIGHEPGKIVYLEDWFAEDYTWEKLKTLNIRQRYPFRSQAYNGLYRIYSMKEVLEWVNVTKPEIGLYIELKQPSYLLKIGLDIQQALFDLLVEYKWLQKSYIPGKYEMAKGKKLIIQCFEASTLQWFKERTTNVPLIQLLYSNTKRLQPDKNDEYSYKDMTTDEGLEYVSKYADGIGPHKSSIIFQVDEGKLQQTDLVERAHRHNLAVHPYTFRSDISFLLKNISFEKEIEMFLDMGIDGLFTDFPAETINILEGYEKTDKKEYPTIPMHVNSTMVDVQISDLPLLKIFDETNRNLESFLNSQYQDCDVSPLISLSEEIVDQKQSPLFKIIKQQFMAQVKQDLGKEKLLEATLLLKEFITVIVHNFSNSPINSVFQQLADVFQVAYKVIEEKNSFPIEGHTKLNELIDLHSMDAFQLSSLNSTLSNVLNDVKYNIDQIHFTNASSIPKTVIVENGVLLNWVPVSYPRECKKVKNPRVFIYNNPLVLEKMKAFETAASEVSESIVDYALGSKNNVSTFCDQFKQHVDVIFCTKTVDPLIARMLYPILVFDQVHSHSIQQLLQKPKQKIDTMEMVDCFQHSFIRITYKQQEDRTILCSNKIERHLRRLFNRVPYHRYIYAGYGSFINIVSELSSDQVLFQRAFLALPKANFYNNVPSASSDLFEKSQNAYQSTSQILDLDKKFSQIVHHGQCPIYPLHLTLKMLHIVESFLNHLLTIIQIEEESDEEDSLDSNTGKKSLISTKKMMEYRNLSNGPDTAPKEQKKRSSDNSTFYSKSRQEERLFYDDAQTNDPWVTF